jgi:putative tricarboxylic transport membrane protein
VRRSAEAAAALVVLAIGIGVAAVARTLPYWHEYAPGPGFFPLWLGVLLAAVALLELVVLFRSREDRPAAPAVPMTGRSWALAILTVVAAQIVPFVGLILATVIFVAAASWTLEPTRKLTNALSTILIPFAVWLIFVAWLGVPLPKGPLGF